MDVPNLPPISERQPSSALDSSPTLTPGRTRAHHTGDNYGSNQRQANAAASDITAQSVQACSGIVVTFVSDMCA